MEKKEKSFEDALNQLEGIVKKLEKPDLPLEESIKLFEDGMSLSKICSEKLDQAQQRVEILQKDASGGMKAVSFEEKKGKKKDEGTPPTAPSEEELPF